MNPHKHKEVLRMKTNPLKAKKAKAKESAKSVMSSFGMMESKPKGKKKAGKKCK